MATATETKPRNTTATKANSKAAASKANNGTKAAVKEAPKPKPPVKEPTFQERKAKDARMQIVANLTELTKEEREARIEEDEDAIDLPILSALATLTPDRLKEIAFISTYGSKDPQSTSPRQHGYQREPMEERFPSIGRYYAKGGAAHLIPALIVSARVYNEKDQKRFIELFNKGDIATIHRDFTKSAFSIIDGQHRAGGLYWAWNNIEDFNAQVPVMMFFGLHYEEEAMLFDDINTNQRKLPKALIEATKVHMEHGTSGHAQAIREIAFSLAEDGDSPWRGYINMTGQRSKLPVSYEGLRRATATMFPEQLMDRLKLRGHRPDEMAKKYWAAVSKACAPAWNEVPRNVEQEDGTVTEEAVKYRLKDLAGVAAVARLGKDIFSTALDRTKTDEDFWDEVTDMVSKLGVVDWEKRGDNPWQAFGAGFAGAKGLYDVLYNLVYNDKAPGVAA